MESEILTGRARIFIRIIRRDGLISIFIEGNYDNRVIRNIVPVKHRKKKKKERKKERKKKKGGRNDIAEISEAPAFYYPSTAAGYGRRRKTKVRGRENEKSETNVLELPSQPIRPFKNQS